MIEQGDKTLFMLIGDVHRQFGHKIRELEKKQGYGTCMNCILFELNHHGKMTQTELVEKIHMRPSSISVALQKMELEQLIERKTKDDDQRYIVVTITEKGKLLCNDFKKQIRELDESITRQIDPEKLEIVKKVLNEVSDSFKGVNDEDI